jgi:menaquinone-dependent protoporphyrinogen oxidase
MKVLVTVASRHGSTAEIGGVIAAVLRAAKIDVDVAEPAAITGIEGYEAVIVGSAVYAGQWLEPAKAFVARHRDQLVEVPVFLFSSGPLGDPPRPDQEPADMVIAEESTEAIDHQVFAGRLTQHALSRPERLVAAVVRAPSGDFRPWDDIADWANQIARFLLADTTEGQPIAVV